MNIILSGMPGCGKTTVSAVLGKKWGYAVADTDKIITERYGSITEIFAKHGEKYFRGLESKTVEEISVGDNLVIATGGGCLLGEKNVKNLKANGKIVYLKTSVNELIKRLSGDSTRPLLKGDAEKNIGELWEKRADVYENTADILIVTDGLTPEQTADAILEKLK